MLLPRVQYMTSRDLPKKKHDFIVCIHNGSVAMRPWVQVSQWVPLEPVMVSEGVTMGEGSDSNATIRDLSQACETLRSVSLQLFGCLVGLRAVLRLLLLLWLCFLMGLYPWCGAHAPPSPPYDTV